MILTDKNTIVNRYIRKKIEKYKHKKAELISSDRLIKGVTIRRKIHPVLMRILHIKSVLSGLTYEIISERKNSFSDKPIIYAITHIGKYDYEMLIEACDIFAYALAGDWELMYATIDDYFLRINGVLYVDTYDKEDRKNSLEYIMKMIKQGIPVLIFPEGIWNLTENLPVMKLYPGVVRAAKECNVPIVPIAIEQIGKHFVINIGKEVQANNMEEIEVVQILRDTLASLKWDIWQYLPREKRENISKDYYKNFLQNSIAEFPAFSVEIIKNRMYKDKTDIEFLAIKRDLEKLKAKKI